MASDSAMNEAGLARPHTFRDLRAASRPKQRLHARREKYNHFRTISPADIPTRMSSTASENSERQEEGNSSTQQKHCVPVCSNKCAFPGGLSTAPISTFSRRFVYQEAQGWRKSHCGCCTRNSASKRVYNKKDRHREIASETWRDDVGMSYESFWMMINVCLDEIYTILTPQRLTDNDKRRFRAQVHCRLLRDDSYTWYWHRNDSGCWYLSEYGSGMGKCGDSWEDCHCKVYEGEDWDPEAVQRCSLVEWTRGALRDMLREEGEGEGEAETDSRSELVVWEELGEDWEVLSAVESEGWSELEPVLSVDI
ncbi:hypothetical protein BDV95DRAFT_572120 [Massariosphaeria phaeospora]|uniref:Uncharacterized protein n=1 Tax=Massariosphaeria phaeospora TaxID=100035 RepID=A0A7C8I5R4_9PLEO|nr:hypothetical protein BDV95DRAFT_572120 [Massariosphaeria phaeospora]